MELKDLSEMHITDMQKSWFRQFNVPYTDDMKMFEARNIILSKINGFEINLPPNKYEFMSNEEFRLHQKECAKKNRERLQKEKGDWE